MTYVEGQQQSFKNKNSILEMSRQSKSENVFHYQSKSDLIKRKRMSLSHA